MSPLQLVPALRLGEHGPTKRLQEAVGGPARERVVVLLACVLALDSADAATIGAVAGQLEADLGISHVQLGLLAAVASIVGALATLPVGILTDRVRRVRLLGISIVLWGVAMFASAASPSYALLLVSHLVLGAVTATAGPTLASLTGDLFPPGERGRIYGFILSGELVGAGFGFVVSGIVAGALGWRWAFVLLGLPALALALALRRLLPEPARGGQSQLPAGATEVRGAEEVESRPADGGADGDAPERGEDPADRAVERQEVQPYEDRVLRSDPARMSLWDAVRYVLNVRTNVVLILASALGYFFFSGLRTFAVVYVRERYGLGQSTASVLLFFIGLGSLAGVLVAGRVADGLIRRGRVDGRLLVAAVGFLAAAVLFVPGLLTGSLALAAVLFFLAAAALATPNPPLDAARLDIVHPGLWGRAEAVRTMLRLMAIAVAPLLFGFVADALGSPGSGFAGVASTATGNGHGLELAFLIMVAPLAVSGLILLRGMRTYPRDVATAIASVRATEER